LWTIGNPEKKEFSHSGYMVGGLSERGAFFEYCRFKGYRCRFHLLGVKNGGEPKPGGNGNQLKRRGQKRSRLFNGGPIPSHFPELQSVLERKEKKRKTLGNASTVVHVGARGPFFFFFFFLKHWRNEQRKRMGEGVKGGPTST